MSKRYIDKFTVDFIYIHYISYVMLQVNCSSYFASINFSWHLTCTPRCLHEMFVTCQIVRFTTFILHEMFVTCQIVRFTTFILLCDRVSYIPQAPRAIHGTKKRGFGVGGNKIGPTMLPKQQK